VAFELPTPKEQLFHQAYSMNLAGVVTAPVATCMIDTSVAETFLNMTINYNYLRIFGWSFILSIQSSMRRH
jgi:hypothetical protein